MEKEHLPTSSLWGIETNILVHLSIIPYYCKDGMPNIVQSVSQRYGQDSRVSLDVKMDLSLMIDINLNFNGDQSLSSLKPQCQHKLQRKMDLRIIIQTFTSNIVNHNNFHCEPTCSQDEGLDVQGCLAWGRTRPAPEMPILERFSGFQWRWHVLRRQLLLLLLPFWKWVQYEVVHLHWNQPTLYLQLRGFGKSKKVGWAQVDTFLNLKTSFVTNALSSFGNLCSCSLEWGSNVSPLDDSWWTLL